MNHLNKIFEIFDNSPEALWLSNLEIHHCRECGKETVFSTCNECEYEIEYTEKVEAEESHV